MSIGPVCSKCAIINKIGILSCCAPGGTWFNKCGRGDEAEYTWIEGLKACQSKLSAAIESQCLFYLTQCA